MKVKDLEFEISGVGSVFIVCKIYVWDRVATYLLVKYMD